MAYVPTNEDIDLLRCKVKTIFTKIELLDSNMNVIDQLEGTTVDGTISIDADSDIRRTYTSTIYLNDKIPISKYDESELLDKYIRVYIGLKSNRTLKWYPIGLFVFNQNGYSYSETDHSLSISCSDLVSKLNNTLAGQLTGQSTVIKEGVSIREAIIETIKLGGFDKYLVDYWNRTVPYDLEYSTGSSIWDILTELRDLYYPFEMYFDDDTFVCKQIPDGYDDPIFISDAILNNFVISEQSNVDYGAVRNCVEVFGAGVSSDYWCNDCSYENGVYTLSFDTAIDLKNGKKISFVAPAANTTNDTFKIINGGVEFGVFHLYSGVDENGNDLLTPANTIKKDKYYVVKYDSKNSCLYYIGQQQAHAMVLLMDKQPNADQLEALKVAEGCDNLKVVYTQDGNVEQELYKSRFSIDRIGRRNLVLSGGEYENYATDESCMEIAQYEHWKKCRLTDTVTINTVLIPWLDVNQKITYKARYLKLNEPTQWIVKKISMALGTGTMSVVMSRFYPLYPEIVQINY